ncbi:MAG: DUF4159 domain-containing protein [Gemmatimonadota bacterium]|jgi:hypothetical protein
MSTKALIAIGLLSAIGAVSATDAPTNASAFAAGHAAHAAAPQDFPWLPYDGSFTFARIRYQDRGGFSGGYGRGRRGFDPGWHHDYPDAERHFSKIVQELTLTRVRQDPNGGNIITLDDPRLNRFPIAYMSEPVDWFPDPDEIEGLRDYLLKGGFIIFDDFNVQRGAMYNLAEQMSRVFPELRWVPVDGTEAIFDCFFKIDPINIVLPSYRGYKPVWYVMYEDNDPDKRILAIAGDQADFGEFWEFSDRGFYPIDLSNEAYKVGVNYLIYALTH